MFRDLHLFFCRFALASDSSPACDTSVTSGHLSHSGPGASQRRSFRTLRYDIHDTIMLNPHISHEGQTPRSMISMLFSSPIYESDSIKITHLSLQSHDTSSPNRKHAHQHSPRSSLLTPPQAGTSTPYSRRSVHGSARSSPPVPADPEARGTEGCLANRCTRGI